MNKGLRVLSLFDGISCGQLALRRAGIPYDIYMASEIDPYAIKITQHHFPNTVQLGDITKIDATLLGDIDLLIGGSPCQGFSRAGNQLQFKDDRSKLVFNYIKILKQLKPKYFLLENVVMDKGSEDLISYMLGVSPILINSSLVSAQNRKRLYWTNLPIPNIRDLGITLGDIYEPNTGIPLSHTTATRPRTLRNVRRLHEKSYCLLATMYKGSQSNGMTVINDAGQLRCITPRECERLQTIPDDYTALLSNTRRYEVLGNAWTVDIIVEIFKELGKYDE